MQLLYGAIIGLIIYSLISTIIIYATNEDDDVIAYFALGICGIILNCICWCILKLKKWHEYHDKRSIILIEETGEHRWCKLKDADDIHSWHKGYRLKKRYAEQSEWSQLEPFSKEFIEWSKRNCDHCRHEKECFKNYADWDNPNVKCIRNKNDVITEFDAFEFK